MAVGGALLGIGGVTLSILIPLAAAAETHPWTATWFLVPCVAAGTLSLIGAYVLSAVYTGWWLPATAAEREGAADLTAEEAKLIRVRGSHVYFSVGFDNQGRGDIAQASVNLLVPAFVTSLETTDVRGNLGHDADIFEVPECIYTDEAGKHWPSLCWAKSLNFPGRTARPVYLRATLEPVRAFPVRVLREEVKELATVAPALARAADDDHGDGGPSFTEGEPDSFTDACGGLSPVGRQRQRWAEAHAASPDGFLRLVAEAKRDGDVPAKLLDVKVKAGAHLNGNGRAAPERVHGYTSGRYGRDVAGHPLDNCDACGVEGAIVDVGRWRCAGCADVAAMAA